MRNFLILIIISISFSYGLFLGVYQVPPFEKIVSLKNLLSRQATVLELHEFSKCNLPKNINKRGKALFAPAKNQINKQKILDLIKKRSDI